MSRSLSQTRTPLAAITPILIGALSLLATSCGSDPSSDRLYTKVVARDSNGPSPLDQAQEKPALLISDVQSRVQEFLDQEASESKTAQHSLIENIRNQEKRRHKINQSRSAISDLIDQGKSLVEHIDQLISENHHELSNQVTSQILEQQSLAVQGIRRLQLQLQRLNAQK